MTTILNDRGFTLLELAVVLLVFGIFSSVVSLGIDGRFSGGDLRLASRMIIGSVSTLRGRAVYSRTERILVLHIDRGALYAVDPENPQGSGMGGTLAGPHPAMRETLLPKGVRLEDVVILAQGKVQEGEARIRFFANGCIDRALIHLRNEQDAVYTLEINPLTGSVTVYDRYIEQRAEAG